MTRELYPQREVLSPESRVPSLRTEISIKLRSRGAGLGTRYSFYTGTGTLSTISRSTWSACSDFFSVEA